MRVLIISPGKPHAPAYRELIGEYEARLGRALPVAWEHPKSAGVEQEGAAILKRIEDADYMVLLDERGKDLASDALAALLTAEEESGRKRVVFVIGGAYGVSNAVKARADRTIRVSAMVLPHQLVRLLLAEQLYRAHSIRTGGKYHHG